MAAAESEPQTTATIDIGSGPEALDFTSWSVRRDLTGGALPSQVRAASGMSVGSGSVGVNAGDGRTPWTATKVAPGGLVSIDAATDVGQALSPVARMKVTDVGAGSALSTKRDASIEDSLTGLRGPVTLPPTLSLSVGRLDASWAIDRAARAGGFYASAPAAGSGACLACIPMIGSLVPEVGTLVSVGTAPTWSNDSSEQIRPASTATSATYFLGPLFAGFGSTLYITLDMPSDGFGDTETVLFSDGSNTIQASFINNGFARIRHAAGTAQDVVFTAGTNARRMQMEVVRTSNTSTTARARVQGGAWGSPVVATGATVPFSQDQIVVTGRATGIQVTAPGPEDALLAWTPTARIAASGSSLSAVLTNGATSAWELAQQVTQATLGALWIDESATLRYRAKEALRGQTTVAGELDALTAVVDLPWSISADDVADRVEVTYNPPDIQTVTDYSLTLWNSTDVVAVGAGKTVELTVDLDGAADSLAPWLPITDTTTAPAGKWSRWAASTQRDGGGAAPPATALQVTSTFINPSKVLIRITNTTAGTLYTAGTDATAQLILRANVSARTGEPVTVALGAPAATAQNPLTVDLGSWVQDDATAQALAVWLSSMTAQALPVLDSVQVVPDLSIRLGDVRILRDPTYTQLVAKVLVVGVDLDGSPGSLTQTLRLAVLAVLNSDVARWLTTSRTNTQAAALVTAALGAGATNTQAAAWYAKGVVA